MSAGRATGHGGFCAGEEEGRQHQIFYVMLNTSPIPRNDFVTYYFGRLMGAEMERNGSDAVARSERYTTIGLDWVMNDG